MGLSEMKQVSFIDSFVGFGGGGALEKGGGSLGHLPFVFGCSSDDETDSKVFEPLHH